MSEANEDALLSVSDVSGCSNVLPKNAMGDDLCKYCPLEKKGAYGVDGGYMAGCEGSRCNDAYEHYLDECVLENDR